MDSGERRKKEKKNRKNTILKAARKLFFEKGFQAVTVDKISASAELSKGTIYLYFSSKEEIYVEILISDNIEFHKSVCNIIKKEASAAETLLDFARLYVDFFLHDKELFRMFMAFMMRADRTVLNDEQNGNLMRAANTNIQLIAEILQKGIDSGEFPPDINVRQGKNAIWGLLNGIISLYLFTGAPAERAKKIHTMINDSLNIFINGLKEKREQCSLSSGLNYHSSQFNHAG